MFLIQIKFLLNILIKNLTFRKYTYIIEISIWHFYKYLLNAWYKYVQLLLFYM